MNLFTVAAATGQTSTPDPTIAALLAKIRSGTTTTGRINDRTDLNTQEYLWQPESLRIDNSPGGRVDYNLTPQHRLSVSYNYQGQRLNPNLFGGDEPNFPGLANQASLYSAVEPRVGDAAVDAGDEPRQRAARRHLERARLVRRRGGSRVSSTIRPASTSAFPASAAA